VDEAIQIVEINSPFNNPTFDVKWANIGDIESNSYAALNDGPPLDAPQYLIDICARRIR
jgi:hypothetical protein